MPYPRTARINEVLREVIADALERQGDVDDRVRLMTVTGVETAADLSHAKVYLSSLDDRAHEVLEELRTGLQHDIGRQVRMKRTPHLTFAADPAVAGGVRIEEILRRLHAEAARGAEDGYAERQEDDPRPRGAGG
jgi:ribosome-binding factor A